MDLVSEPVPWRGTWDPGGPWVLGESSIGVWGPGAPHPASLASAGLGVWGGGRGGVALFGMALLFLDGLCPFQVLSSLLPSFPALPTQGCWVVITGLLCLWWLVSSLADKEAGLSSLPLHASWLPKDCCVCGV